MAKMHVQTYKQFYIVKYTNKSTFDLVNTHTGKLRVVKSEQAAKWRITRAVNLAARYKGLA